MPAYYAIREMHGYHDVVLHADADCPEGPVRAAGATVNGERCPDCTAAGDDDAAEPDVCTVELSAGGTCGRDRPCPYHD